MVWDEEKGREGVAAVVRHFEERVLRNIHGTHPNSSGTAPPTLVQGRNRATRFWSRENLTWQVCRKI